MRYLRAICERAAKAIGRGDKDGGAALAESGLLLGLIAVVCLASVTTLGTKISSVLSTVARSL